jgi:hypothetical protein
MKTFNNIELVSFIDSIFNFKQDLFSGESNTQSITDNTNVVRKSNDTNPSINFEDLCSLLTNPTVKSILDSDGNELNLDSPILLSSINCFFSNFSNKGISLVAQELKKLIEDSSDYEGNTKPDPLQLAFMNIGAGSVIDQSVYEEFEYLRLSDKYISNSLGLINSTLLTLIEGFDRVDSNESSLDVHIRDQNGNVISIIKVKNRHNSMNSNGQIKAYQKMSELVSKKGSQYFERTSILAVRIPKAKGIKPFAPVNGRGGKRLPQDDKIVEMDFDTLMARYSGDQHAYLRSYVLVLFILAYFKVIPEDTDISYYLKAFVKSLEV